MNAIEHTEISNTKMSRLPDQPVLPVGAGEQMHRLMQRLYPICRSITGAGVRDTLRIISDEIPLEIRNVASSEKVFDWTIPREWNIRDAYIRNSLGEKIVDFNNHNLHVVGYSAPLRRRMRLEQLKERLHTI